MNLKQKWSWAFYDWANSAFSTTIMAGFFPIFFKQYWSSSTTATQSTAALGLALSISGAFTALVSPFLGAWSDYKSLKKRLCAFFMILGSTGCLLLGVVPQGDWFSALVLYAMTLFAFSTSCVFYDSLLPLVARGEESDLWSSIGYAMGYLGGGVLFLVNVLMSLNPQWFGLENSVQAVKLSFVSVGLWWFIFSLPMLFYVKEPKNLQLQKNKTSISLILSSFLQTLKKVFADRQLRIFILAYWLYIDGVYTVMAMAVDYGMAMGLDSTDLIKALLLVQFIGFPSTWIFGLITKNIGQKIPLLFCIGVYSVAVILAVGMKEAWHFYALALVIGLVQGGVQSLSRSLFCQMIPSERSGEYFGFFNLVGKFASVFGPFVVAITVLATGRSEFGMTGLLILFVLGGGLLSLVQTRRDRVLAGGL